MENAKPEQNTNETGTLVHLDLARPVTYNGEEIAALDFDFEALTGDDGTNVEQEIQAHGRAVLIPALDGEYLLGMAARACRQGVGTDFFGKASLKDTLKIRSLARNFLRDAD